MLQVAGLGGGGGYETEAIEGRSCRGHVAKGLLEEPELEVCGGQGGVELDGLGEEFSGGRRVREVSPEDGGELDVDVGVGGIGFEGATEGLSRLGVALEGKEGIGDGKVGLGGPGRVGGGALGLDEGILGAAEEDERMGTSDARRDGLGILGEGCVQEGKAPLGLACAIEGDGDLVQKARVIGVELGGPFEQLHGQVGSAHAAQLVGLGELVRQELHVLGRALGPRVWHRMAGGGGPEGEGHSGLVGATHGAEGLAEEELGRAGGGIDGQGSLQEREGERGLAVANLDLAQPGMAAPFVGGKLDEPGECPLGVGEVPNAKGCLRHPIPSRREGGEVTGQGLELGQGGGVVWLFLEGDGRVEACEGLVGGDADDVEEGLAGLGPEAIGAEGEGEGRAAGGVAGRVGDEGGQPLQMIPELGIEGFGLGRGDDGQERRAPHEMEGDGGEDGKQQDAEQRHGPAGHGRSAGVVLWGEAVGRGHEAGDGKSTKQKVARGLRGPPCDAPWGEG